VKDHSSERKRSNWLMARPHRSRIHRGRELPGHRRDRVLGPYDPFVEPGFTRDPVVEETTVVIVGGGFAGMLTAIHLAKHDVVAVRAGAQHSGAGGRAASSFRRLGLDYPPRSTQQSWESIRRLTIDALDAIREEIQASDETET